MNFCVALLSGSQLHILTKSLRRVGRQTQCLPGDFIELRSVMCFTCPGIVQAHSDCICMFPAGCVQRSKAPEALGKLANVRTVTFHDA